MEEAGQWTVVNGLDGARNHPLREGGALSVVQVVGVETHSSRLGYDSESLLEAEVGIERFLLCLRR